VNRGNLTLWVSEDVVSGWLNHEKTGKRGSSNHYSDLAIECGLTFRELYKIGFRTGVVA